MTRLVAVVGAAPGAGKSTLCAGLADWMAARGVHVHHFREEDVLARDVFAPPAREFTTTNEVRLATLLDTTAAYLAEATADDVDVVVTDALVPFVPSLMGWGYSEMAIASFLHELAARLKQAEPIVGYIDDDPAHAIPRAVAREGPEWQDWLVDKLSHYPVDPPIHDFESACAYLRHEREVTLRLLSELPWHVITVPQSEPPSAAVLQHTARAQLADTLELDQLIAMRGRVA